MPANRRAVSVATTACVTLVLAASVPWLASWDLMRLGYAWMAVTGAAAGIALIAALVFRARERQERELISHTGEFLAEWAVPVALWRAVVAEQFADEVAQKRTLLHIVWGACLVCALGFLIADPDGGRWVGVAMAGVACATWLAAHFSPRLRRRRLESAETVVRIGRRAVMLGDELHTWQPRGSRLEGAGLRDSAGLSWLEIRYSFLTRGGRHEEQVRLPVPPAERANAERVAGLLSAP